MTTSGLSVPARRRALAPLRGFCGWLVRSRRLAIDPTQDEDLTVRGGAQALPVSFTDDELARITAAAARGASTVRDAQRWPARDLALLALLAGCGLRASEVCTLTWSGLADLDQAEPGVRVRGKGGRQRRVPLAPRITATLLDYRRERPQRTAPGRCRSPNGATSWSVPMDGR